MPNSNVTSNDELGEYYYLNIHCDGTNCIYLDEYDYHFFTSILQKYLLKNGSVEILAYCLESNHFDLLLFQSKDNGIKKLMNNIMTSYNQYYDDKYGVSGLLPDDADRLVQIASSNLLDVSRSIHISPDDWIDYPHSSLRAYFYDDVPDWLNKDYIVDQYGSAVKYLKFLSTL
jgi:REP element-mobilizing transposase RayT